MKRCVSGVATASALEKCKKEYGDLNFRILKITSFGGNIMIQIKDGVGISDDFFCNDGGCVHRISIDNKEL